MKHARGRIALLGAAFVGSLLTASSAQAASFSASNITQPLPGAELFYDGDTGSGSIIVKGTTTPAIHSGSADLLCYIDSDTGWTKVATGIPVSSGAFNADVSLANIAGQACRLRAVPAGGTPTGSAAGQFAGPAISISDQVTNSAGGNVFGYRIDVGPLPWAYKFESLGECPISASYATDPNTLASYALFFGNACLLASSGVAPNMNTRSGLVVDGLNAYPPGAISPLTGTSGFAQISYAPTFDATHDTVTINETDVPMVCGAPDGYPPSGSRCPSLTGAGILVGQRTTLISGGQVARITQTFASLDGHPHSLDLLFAQSVRAPASGRTPGFEFPGQTAFARHAQPDSVTSFPSGPGTITVVGDVAASPSTANPVGSITYQSPPLGAYFISASGAETATFLMHYAGTVPAHGGLSFQWSFSQAADAQGLIPLEVTERDRFYVPTVRITAPRSGRTLRRRLVAVRGFARDAVGIAAVSVNGHGASVGLGGGYGTTVTLRKGRNRIRATAVNFAGISRTAAVTVTYKPLPCTVPKLAGRTLAQARRALANHGCTLGKLRRVHSHSVRRGRVVSFSPRAGSHRRPDARVALVISAGP